MSAILSAAAEIIARYAAGYFPLYDIDNHFYWERLPIRAVIPVTPEALAKAKEMGRRGAKKFLIRHTTAVPRIIELLQNPRIKPNTWVRREVVNIYHVLHTAGLLRTVEAFDAATGELAGGLLGLVFPGTYIAETMLGLRPDASKACLCELVKNCAAAGHHMIDVQTPHDLDELSSFGLPALPRVKTPHPCIRLGEQTLPLAKFLRLFREGAIATFPGSLGDWLTISTALAAAGRAPEKSASLLAGLPPHKIAAALRILRDPPSV